MCENAYYECPRLKDKRRMVTLEMCMARKKKLGLWAEYPSLTHGCATCKVPAQKRRELRATLKK